MALFEKALEASVMSTKLLIRADLSKTLLLQAYQIAKDFEARYSAYRDNSFLNQINTQAGKSPLDTTPKDMALFSVCHQASLATEGVFDISIGALSHGAYHFGFANQSLASSTQIKTQKKLVNYKNIILKENTIFLAKKGMRLDLGAIGKGYVAKEIALFLKAKGASKILVDVGGEIFTLGKSYTIAIKNPFTEGNLAYIKTSTAPLSFSTSGNYVRFIDDKNHHILDKSLGKSSAYYSSLSLMQNSWDIDLLDAYATALFNQNPQKLKSMGKKLKLSMLIIHQDGEISLQGIDKLQIKELVL